MKILMISNMYPSRDDPTYGIFVKNFQEQLEKLGVSFELAVIRGRSNSKLQKIQKYLKFFNEVIRSIMRNNYDLIYVHYINHSLIPLIFTKKNINKPLILNAHGSDVFTSNKLSSYIQKLTKGIIELADLVVVPSLYFEKVVIDKFNVNNVYIFPSGGVNTKLFKPLNLKRNDIFTIGYVSRIDKGKGWDIFLKSLYILRQNGIKFSAIVVGDGKEKKEFLKLINDLRLNDNIVYYGSVPHNKLPEIFNLMDIFIFPSIRAAESLGLVGLEAMACGIPVIGSRMSGLLDYIKDEYNGKLFTPGDVSELVEAIKWYINLGENEKLKLKRNALETAKRFDSEKVFKNLYVFLKERFNL